MMIANSQDDKCIRNLMTFLERSYPGVSFKMTIGRTSRIEVPDDEIDLWNDVNKGIFNRIETFCEGYTIGWEAATS